MSRKEELKKIILNDKYLDIEMYRLIDTEEFDLIIPKLRKKHIIINDIDDEDNEKIFDSNKHIIILLNNFLHFFKTNFRELSPYYELILKTIISSNTNLFIRYFNEDNLANIEKNFQYYRKWHYKLSVANFIKNTYFSSVKKLFKKNNIPIKNIDKYSEQEIKNIFNLLTNVIKSSTIDIDHSLLFQDFYNYIYKPNISKEIKEYLLNQINELYEPLNK